MGRSLGFIGAVCMVVALFIAANIVLSNVRGVRLDVSEGRVYTLTKGSRAIAKSPAEPVTLTMYYTAALAEGQPPLQSHARRVREMLEEYARESEGKVRVKFVNPAPFSEAEDEAVSAGLAGIPVNSAGDNLYLGLVGTNAVDGREVLPFFDPEKERFLEYELSRMIFALANPKKKVVGLISGLPLEGGVSFDQRTRQPRQTPAWQIAAEIGSLFEMRSLLAAGADIESIPADVDVLMLVHPKNLSTKTQFAIDQYVLRGGKLLAFVDPLAEGDETGLNPMTGMAEGGRGSQLGWLLDAWGVEIEPGKLAADAEIALKVNAGTAQRPEPIPFVVYMGVTGAQMSREDPVTGDLMRVNIATPGVIRVKVGVEPGVGDGLKIEPLIWTTEKGGVVDASVMEPIPDPKRALEAFVPGTERLTLAARLTGVAKTAFPTPPEGVAAEGAIQKSAAPVNVIVVADADMLADLFWVQSDNLFGTVMKRKVADNGSLVMSALDNLTGSSDLISVRARREVARPFEKVEAMQRRADDRVREEQGLLEAKLAGAQQRIEELRAARPGQSEQDLVLSPEVRKEVDDLRAEVVKTRQRLREVRLEGRQDVERLGTLMKVLNIAAVPALLTVGALLVGIARRARARA